MIEKLKVFLFLLIAFICVLLILFSGFVLQRSIHWTWGYKPKVEQTIEERIIPLEARIEELENVQKEKQIKDKTGK